MKTAIILITVLFSISIRLSGQTRTIQGRVISEDLETLPYATIRTVKYQEIGKTDVDGRFKINIPKNTKTLLFGYIGMEWATVKLNDDCDTIEIVLMSSVNYEWMRATKIDRLRLARFNKLPELYLQAYKKGIFKKDAVCYTREFEPEKPQLDSIGREDVKIRKHIKLLFKKLTIGDTVKIPFSDWGGYRADGTDRTTLTEYSSYSGGHHRSGCTLKCVVIDKNKHKRAYNIVCKVVDCVGCKDPSIFNGRVMQPGEVFNYNMKYGEILDE